MLSEKAYARRVFLIIFLGVTLPLVYFAYRKVTSFRASYEENERRQDEASRSASLLAQGADSLLAAAENERKGDLSKAQIDYRRAISAIEKVDPKSPQIGVAKASLADVMIKQGKEAGDPPRLLEEAADLFMAAGDRPSAKTAAERLRDLSQKSGRSEELNRIEKKYAEVLSQ